ncbi:hypothetical protein N9I01_00080 [bacterium]|nr:hypothetical protein [bacterium]
MDPISILIGLVVVAGIATLVYQKSSSSSDTPASGTATKAKAPVAQKAPASTTPTKKKAEPSARVKALKSTDAVKANAPVAKKVPTKTALLKLTKANIESEARDHGIELDARKTKENMVADFQKAAKANAKAAIK